MATVYYPTNASVAVTSATTSDWIVLPTGGEYKLQIVSSTTWTATIQDTPDGTNTNTVYYDASNSSLVSTGVTAVIVPAGTYRMNLSAHGGGGNSVTMYVRQL